MRSLSVNPKITLDIIDRYTIHYIKTEFKGGALMSWKTQIGIDQMHPAFTEFRYMDNHDTDECERCHERGDHENLLEWKDACEACDRLCAQIEHEEGEHDRAFHHYSRCHRCAQEIEAVALHATFEFSFTLADVTEAKIWAAKNDYYYDDVNHLLHDAMTAGAVKPRGWKAA